jgi:hypothetical protein
LRIRGREHTGFIPLDSLFVVIESSRKFQLVVGLVGRMDQGCNAAFQKLPWHDDGDA